jgi:hypothetical protein
VRIWDKTEFDDNFYFKKTESISIRVADLEQCDAVRLYIRHLNVRLWAWSRSFFDYGYEAMYHNEPKRYLNVRSWAVLSGPQDWWVSFTKGMCARWGGRG